EYTASALGLGRNGWDAGRLGRVLARAVQAWVAWHGDDRAKDDILEEAAGVPYDIWQELDARGDDEKTGLDEEEACVVGETLQQLAEYIVPLKFVSYSLLLPLLTDLPPLRNRDGTPYILPLGPHPPAPTPLLRRLCSLLSRDHAVPTSPLLSTILIPLSSHLTDASTSLLPL
ncbi:hypothetical protein DXG01_016379, partial [Tephrocybe rancida]